MKQNFQTVSDINARCKAASAEELAVLERALAGDARKGVQAALEGARRRLAHEAEELARVSDMYEFERSLAQGGVAIGLDEVGRGPLAGPLAVGAVVLPAQPLVPGLNDSKQLAPEARERIASEVERTAVAWTVEYVEPADIDAWGMTRSLRTAFLRAVERLERGGVRADAILLDGNPLHLDPREVSVVKGDAKCASIAAASVVAKVHRDRLMERLAKEYPAYGFEANKGYASAAHQQAIRYHGLSPVHRASFCTAFMQQSLF